MREYHTSREFKLAGNPWWADGTSEDAAIEFYLLKGQCPEIFDQIFVKNSTCALYKQAKTVSKFVSFLQKYSQKRLPTDKSSRSQRLRGHHGSEGNDYADTCFSQIFSGKRNNSKNRFSLFIRATGRDFFSLKRGRKSRYAVPLSSVIKITNVNLKTAVLASVFLNFYFHS